jgi:hypothetical protein
MPHFIQFSARLKHQRTPGATGETNTPAGLLALFQ